MEDQNFIAVLKEIRVQFEKQFKGEELAHVNFQTNIYDQEHCYRDVTLGGKKKTDQKPKYLSISFMQTTPLDHIFVSTVITFKKKSFSFICFLCHPNGDPLVIQDKMTKNLLTRYFLRLNFRLGELCMDPMTGQIQFRISTAQDFSKIKKNDVETLVIKRLIKIGFSTAYYSIEFHLIRIAFMAGLISEKIYHGLSLIQKQDTKKQSVFKIINEKYFGYFQQLYFCLDSIRKNIDFYQIDQKYQGEFKKYLSFPKSNETGTGIKTLKEWEDFKEEISQSEKIGQGGFADIFKVYGQPIEQYTDEQKKNRPAQQDYYAKKVSKPNLNPQPQERDKLPHEIEILKMLNNSCPFVNKYYYNKKEPQCLYMELAYTCLDKYIAQHKQILSLNTKIFFIVQIAMTLKFLRDNNIYHLDLKPSNILLGMNLFIKTNDFGESYHTEMDQQLKDNFTPAFTLPYTSPEIIQFNTNRKGLSHKCDIFSLGGIISEIIFEKKIFDTKRISQRVLIKKLANLQYRSTLPNSSINQAGCKHILQVIRILMFMCIHPDPNQRPQVEYLIVIFKILIQALEVLY